MHFVVIKLNCIYHLGCFIAFQKILTVLEGLRYDIKLLAKQQEKIAMQLQQTSNSRQVDNAALFPFSEFELDLPLETIDKVHQLEEKLEDPSQVQSGKNLM